jgi:hypothetical protein
MRVTHKSVRPILRPTYGLDGTQRDVANQKVNAILV